MERKVTVTQRAFLARMKRHIAKEGETLKQAREGTRVHQEWGPFYTIDEQHNSLARQCLELATLEAWARDDGVLKPYEVIEAEPA